mgnify:CR=1 FL=1
MRFLKETPTDAHEGGLSYQIVGGLFAEAEKRAEDIRLNG